MTANDYLVGLHWHDVIVIGAGYNGLVAALLFAKKGLKVLVVEEKDALGGASCTERPFANAPDLGASTGAGLVGLMPPELLAQIDVELPLIHRDPHTFLPTTGARYLVLGADRAQTKEQLTRFAGEADGRAHEAMHAELSAFRDDVARSWLAEPMTIEETAERYVQKPLRTAFVDLCRGSVAQYLERWGFESERLLAMYAMKGLTGGSGSYRTPGTGMCLLTRHMGRMADDGAWSCVSGGMGTVAHMIADRAIRHGAVIETEAKVSSIVVEGGVARGIVLKDGTMHHATAVLCNADPFRMREMLGKEKLPAEYNARLDAYRRDGMAMKVNLALRGVPQMACWPGGAFNRSGFAPTTHLLPGEEHPLRSLEECFEAAKNGKLHDSPPIDLFVHTAADPSLQDASGHHHASLFVQWVPYDLAGTTWEAEEAGYVQKLLAICDGFAPGMSDLVVDTFTLHPQKIEQHFGITRGHVQHVDNAFGFSDRLPYRTPVQGLYTCSAGTHPAGAVIGAAGHNAALRLLVDMGKPLTAPPPR